MKEFWNKPYSVKEYIYGKSPNSFFKDSLDSMSQQGKLILEVFSKNQLHVGTGGPKDSGMLYSAETLEKDFQSLKIETLKESTIMLDEGDLHQGEACVIRMIAQKT